jgi:hypothetical protein
MFGGKTKVESGLKWYEFGRLTSDKLRTPLSIVVAFVATHNHFVLDRGGKVFKQSAPVIKLPLSATEDDHLALLGLLNSSTACFWMKQVMNCKGLGGQGGGIKPEHWSRQYEYAGTALEAFPVPAAYRAVIPLARRLDALAHKRAELRPSRQRIQHCLGCLRAMSLDRVSFEAVTREMVGVQEELDWLVCSLYGVAEYVPANDAVVASGLHPEERPVEILHKQVVASGEPSIFYEVHSYRGTGPLTQPGNEGYAVTSNSRLAQIRSSATLRLLEQLDYKRRWQAEPWDDQLSRALRSWLLQRLESYLDFDGRMNDDGKSTAQLPVALVSVGRLADIARRDPQSHEVGALYLDDEAFDVTRLVTELVESESVPLLPILRYKPSGLRKRAEWESTWELQRQEDAIDARTELPKDHMNFLDKSDAQALKKKQVGTIPVPPKYTSADFLKADFWRLRGKLDVPKERWVSFPYCEGEDGTLMVAWAGYDHLQLAQAISAHFVDVQERLGGREDPRLVPLLACVIELLPWLKQWHNDIHSEYGVGMGDYFEGFLQEESRNLGLTLDQIRAWQPPVSASSRSRRRANA